jgi:hypothetical protein
MAGGFEMCVLDGTNTLSLIRPGHECTVRSSQFIRRWGLFRESVPGQSIGDEKVLTGRHLNNPTFYLINYILSSGSFVDV